MFVRFENGAESESGVVPNLIHFALTFEEHLFGIPGGELFTVTYIQFGVLAAATALSDEKGSQGCTSTACDCKCSDA